MHSEPSEYVKLASSLAGIFLVITLAFIVWARDEIGILVPIVWAFVVLGIVLGHYQYKTLTHQQPKPEKAPKADKAAKKKRK